MTARSIPALCVVLGVLGGVQFSYADAGASHRLLEAENVPANPRYLLVGPGGQAVSSDDFRGRYQLVTFGYTFCPDVCPTTLVEMASVLKALGEMARDVQPIFVTLDPERDTLPVLMSYTSFFDPRILGLTGSPELISRAAHSFRVRYAKVPNTHGDPRLYAVDHSAGLYLVAPDGSLIRKFAYGKPAAEIAAEMNQLLAERPASTRSSRSTVPGAVAR
jgi:protein SCO1/2